jgi:hypothetical protein
MGLWPPRADENQTRRPPESGGPLGVGTTMDSRFRGNDTRRVILWSAEDGPE